MCIVQHARICVSALPIYKSTNRFYFGQMFCPKKIVFISKLNFKIFCTILSNIVHVFITPLFILWFSLNWTWQFAMISQLPGFRLSYVHVYLSPRELEFVFHYQSYPITKAQMSSESRIIKFGFVEHVEFVDKGKLKHRAKCRFCPEKKTTIVETKGTTTGFTKHCRRCHPKQWVDSAN